MTQEKRTPGPWHAATSSSSHGDTMIIANRIPCVAIAYNEDTRANAALIAVALELLAALKVLRRAYVNFLESGRDRTIALGGACDPVDVMEANDPWLREVSRVIDKATGSAA